MLSCNKNNEKNRSLQRNIDIKNLCSTVINIFHKMNPVVYGLFK